MRRLKRLTAVLATVFILGFALIGVLTITRGTPVRSVITMEERGPPPVTDSLFERSIELFTGARIDSGNRVELLLNGDGSYPRLWDDLRSAHRTITMQNYYSLPGAVADTLAAILADRARAKVRVLLLLDAFGSQHLIGGWTDSLRKSGVEVALLRKLRWFSIHNASDRSHVRSIVIDGRIGYTGGFGLADYWLGDGHTSDEWRESNVRFEGPAVMQLQAAFAAAWAEATGELLTGDLFFPRRSFLPVGKVHAAILVTAPTTGSTPAERFLAVTIAGSRKRLYIANSYFVPDEDFRRLLVHAASRGVDVRVLTVSRKTDVKTTWYAGRRNYEELLQGGVRIWEYQPSMMHAKTLTMDGRLSTIGSMNFDNRSLAFNNESNLVVLDSAFAAKMDSIFFDDLRQSKEITLTEFEHRGRWERIKEWGASLISRLL